MSELKYMNDSNIRFFSNVLDYLLLICSNNEIGIYSKINNQSNYPEINQSNSVERQFNSCLFLCPEF